MISLKILVLRLSCLWLIILKFVTSFFTMQVSVIAIGLSNCPIISKSIGSQLVENTYSFLNQ